jgi:hypothetical protein
VQDERAVPISKRVQNRVPKFAREDQLPIAIGDISAFMEINYYGDPGLLSRISYLAGPEYDLRYNGGNYSELAMIRSAPYFGTHVVDYNTWTKSHRNFYLLKGEAWAIMQLIHDGAQLQLLQGRLDNLGRPADSFFRVTMPAQ